MGIYLLNMEMPKDGEILFIKIYPSGKVAYDLDLKCKQIATAVEIPPHGRAIDAKLVRDEMIKKWLDNAGDSFMYKRGMEDAYEVIRNAPTIIPADTEGET